MITVSEALDIAEDRIAGHYKFSSVQWKRHRYDVKTLSGLKKEEIVPKAFALLYKACGNDEDLGFQSRKSDFYWICLQDHEILKAVKRDQHLGLLPLLVYIFTHELVHIVRFSNFLQRFEVPEDGRQMEEKIVHSATHDILRGLSLPKLDYVLSSYQHHGIRDVVLSSS